ncbi:hypothetical protein KUCAC02_034437, partial [Chaenocephalus aceratus]
LSSVCVEPLSRLLRGSFPCAGVPHIPLPRTAHGLGHICLQRRREEDVLLEEWRISPSCSTEKTRRVMSDPSTAVRETVEHGGHEQLFSAALMLSEWRLSLGKAKR